MQEDEIIPYIAEQHRIPFISLDRYDVDAKVSAIIPDEIISAYNVIPIDLIRDIITLAIVDVPSDELIRRIEKFTRCKIQVIMITKGDFDRYMKGAYNLSVIDKDRESEHTDINRLIETPEYNGKERRRYPRFNLKLRVKYEFKDEVNVNSSVNISRGGILIKSKSPVPVNAHIIMRIELPTSHEDIIAISRVAWVEKSGDGDTYMVALSFSSMDSYDNRTLTAFIESLGK